MSIADYLILTVLAVWLALSIHHIVREKKRGGGCCGDCSACSFACEQKNCEKGKHAK